MAKHISLASIKNHKWYRQQTEGTPYFIYLPCRGCLEWFKSDKIIWYCDLEEARAYLEQNHIRDLAVKHIAKEKKQVNFSLQIRKEWLKDIKQKNEKIFAKINSSNLAKLSDKELLQINQQLGQQSYKMWLKFFMDIFDIDAESLIEQELIKERVTLTSDEKNIMTLPAEPIVHQHQELVLLQIAQMVKDNSDYLYLVNQIQDLGNVHRLAVYPKLLKAINHYINKYHWVRNSWAHVYKINQFDVVDQIKQIASSSRNISEEINKLKKYKVNLTKQQKAIAKKHKLSGWLIRMFGMFGLMALWRDERKEQMQQMHYYLQMIGTEIAKRSNLTWDQIKVCDPLSITTLPVTIKQLDQYRKILSQNMLMHWDGKKVQHFSAPVSKKFVTALEATFSTKMTEVRGLIACPGRVKGEVVVINKKSEFGKMSKGKILVTTMTRPDFLPLMKMAAGVVTDEGGITSHAAIVSRELKIPCIIGTQVGTKVLKDGYQVEVNANHGVVLVFGKK